MGGNSPLRTFIKAGRRLIVREDLRIPLGAPQCKIRQISKRVLIVAALDQVAEQSGRFNALCRRNRSDSNPQEASEPRKFRWRTVLTVNHRCAPRCAPNRYRHK